MYVGDAGSDGLPGLPGQSQDGAPGPKGNAGFSGINGEPGMKGDAGTYHQVAVTSRKRRVSFFECDVKLPGDCQWFMQLRFIETEMCLYLIGQSLELARN